jgi:hypothetical protein
MAVGTQQYALRRFFSHLSDPPREATTGDAELLGRRIEMVEMKRPDIAVVSAQPAASAGLGDQFQSSAPPPVEDPLLPASLQR